MGLKIYELFSCRNHIHECSKNLLIGRGPDFFVKQDSVISCAFYEHAKDARRSNMTVLISDL